MLTSELRILLAFLVAYFSAVFVIPRLAAIAQSIGLIDRPERRKVHREPRPLVGGIGLVIAATFSSMFLVPLQGFRGFFLGLAVLLFIGFLDDFRQMEARSKFLAHIGAGMLMIYFSKARLVSFGDLLGFGDIVLPDLALVIWPVTIFCLVGVINAINLIDGLDGLAGGVTFIAFLSFGLHASLAGSQVFMLLNLAFAGAVLGFLRFNWHPSRVFMGDAGSLCLGFTLGFMAIIMTQGENAVIPPVVALLILAVPITDTLTVMGKRIVRGKNPFQADRYHFHHILMRYGVDRETAVHLILGICVVMSGLTLLVPFFAVPEWALFAGYLGYLVVYVVASFFIVPIMRMTFKHRYQRVQEKGGRRPFVLVRSLLRSLDYLKILRKDPRYTVNLSLRCRLPDREEELAGQVENISRRGCMAVIPELALGHGRLCLTICVLLEDDVHQLRVEAEQIWTSERQGIRYHGFKFHQLLSPDQEVFDSFLARCKRHKTIH